MRLHTETATAEVQGETGRKTFAIKSSQKAFSILSSGLYSDKILAVVRELSCNAYDSHVEAGKKDVPFEVHFPNKLNPEFYIKDFGIGLDHDGVMDVYTTYFESTKQDSDDYVGALGLGSKSPFSYTDSFVITAIKDGVKRIYSAMVEDGFPTVVKFGQDVKTDEPNGVEIRFAVKPEDFNRFAEAAKKVYRWFDVLPTIKGNQIRVESVKFDHENIIPGVSIRKMDQFGFNYGDRRPYARQGTVAYPIDPNDEDIDEDLVGLLEVPLIIDFPIGSLDITPSRESLSYIKFTNDNINKRLREISSGLEAYVKRELDAAKTDWERLVLIHKMNDRTFKPILSAVLDKTTTLFEHIETVTQWGTPYLAITKNAQTAGNFTVSEYDVRVRNRNTGAVRLSKVNMQSEPIRDRKDQIIKDAHGNPTYKQYYRVNVGSETRFYINDTDKRNVLGRVREDLKNNYKSGDVFVVTLHDKKALENFKKATGYVGYTLISDLPDPPRVTRRTGTGTKITLLSFEFSTYGAKNDWVWTEVTSSIKDIVKEHAPKKVLYVPLKNRTILNGDKEWNTEVFRSFVQNLSRIGVIDSSTSIIGARKSVQDKLTNDYVNLFDFARTELKKVCVSQLSDAIKIRSMADQMKRVFSLGQIEALAKQLPNHKLGQVALQSVNTMKLTGLQNPGNVPAILFVSNRVGADIDFEDEDKLENAARKEWTNLISNYPMLMLVNMRGQDDREIKKVIEYINLVDKAA